MAFLLKHYEKILLAVLLTVFIGLLAFQLVLWRQNEQIQVEELRRFKDPPPNYQAVNFDDPKCPFRILENLASKPAFEPGKPRETAVPADGGPLLFTDFMVPYPMALCPYCSRVIPATAFPLGDGESKCPLEDCRKTLHAPFSLAAGKDLDSDSDGIPDKDEIQMRLNPKFGGDASADADGDGFTNYEEYVCKTDCNDPKSRPPYHEKMMVLPINRRKLPFKLKQISFANNIQNLDNSRIVMQIDRSRNKGINIRFKDELLKKKKDSKFFIFPEDRMTEGSLSKNKQALQQQYAVVEVIPKMAKSGGFDVNESKVVVQKFNRRTKTPEGDKITVEIGRDVFEPRIRADLVIGSKPREIYVGSDVSEGDIKTGVDHYKVTGIDEKKNAVNLEYLGDNKALAGKSFMIERTSILQKKLDDAQKARQPRRSRQKAGSKGRSE